MGNFETKWHNCDDIKKLITTFHTYYTRITQDWLNSVYANI